MISKFSKQITNNFSKIGATFATTKTQKNDRFFIVQYEYVEDMYYKRIQHRDKHLKLIEKLEKDGALIFGGSLFPLTGGYIFFNCQDDKIPKKFIDEDPYIKNSLVKEYKIQEVAPITKKEFLELSQVYKYQ